MLFNSINFLIFFPIVLLIYFIVPKKVRYIWLLISSYYFYMSWNPKYALLIGFSTLITYICSLLVDKENQKQSFESDKTRLKKIIYVGFCIIINLGILGVFKYANFFLDNFYKALTIANISVTQRKVDLLLPVGISFYTFQALSYTIDVYKGNIKAEKNLLKYALFVSFFPQLVAGPIERSGNLLTQIQNVDKINLFDYDRIKKGFLLLLYGYFQKLVIADRASILVDNVINNYDNYGFYEILLALFLFAFQIYCDFNGYTIIARGAAKIMGFELMNNFKQPYLATNIKEFWRRWHISLTSWFTDYLYIPLGGNRKGEIRKYINILIVFTVSGLWHGASWNYVIWGIIHGIYLVIGNIKNKFFPNIAERMPKLLGIVITFCMVDFAWLFFVSSSFTHAVNILRHMRYLIKNVTYPNFETLGLIEHDWVALIVGIICLIIADILNEKKISVYELLQKQKAVVRWMLYVALFWFVMLLGAYGKTYDTSTFIYFQF